MNKKIAITIGDPAGIGTEILIKALSLRQFDLKNIVIIGNKEILKKYGANDSFFKTYEIVDLPFDTTDFTFGVSTAKTGDFAFRTIVEACKLAKNKLISGIVTAPVAKEAMILAGHNFSGQTEVLEKHLGHDNQRVQMLFCSPVLNVLLLTRHLPLKNVAAKITIENFVQNVLQLDFVFKTQFNKKNPKFALCGINPHAGENGYLGREEQDIFIPAIKILNSKGIDITQPQPADALFAKIAQNFFKGEKTQFDCIISPYHDQGLIPVKMLAGKIAVNTTIGLDVLRTAPAHGTAFDIAGKNIADPESMIEAINLHYL